MATIASNTYPNVYLRMYLNAGQSTCTVNCQFGGTPNTPAGQTHIDEQFTIHPLANDIITIESNANPGYFLHYDGSLPLLGKTGATSLSDNHVQFRLVQLSDGGQAIESIHSPGYFLSMDGTGLTSFQNNGGGVVSMQQGLADLSKISFTIAQQSMPEDAAVSGVPLGSVETVFPLGSQAQSASTGITLNENNFTITAWIKLHSIETGVVKIIERSGDFYFGFQGNKMVFSLGGKTVTIDPDLSGDALTWTQNQWHYVACVVSDSQAQCYFDGHSVGAASSVSHHTSNSNPFVFAQNLQGSLGSVRIYGHALAAETVLTEMFQPTNDTSVVADFDFSTVPPVNLRNSASISLSGGAQARLVTPGLALRGGAYAFPMPDASVSTFNANQSYTIQAWLWLDKPVCLVDANDGLPSNQVIVATAALNDPGCVAFFLQYDVTAQLYRLGVQRGSNTAAATTQQVARYGDLAFEQWHNVALNYNASTGQSAVYLDGVCIDLNSSTDIHALAATPTALTIGGARINGQTGAAWPLQGALQSVNIWQDYIPYTAIAKFQSAYPVGDDYADTLLAHYDFSTSLVRNENTGAAVGLADLALVEEFSDAISDATAPLMMVRARRMPTPSLHEYEQLPADEMAQIRAKISFADRPDLDKALELAMNTDFSAKLEQFMSPALAAKLRGKLKANWTDARQRLRDNPLSMPLLITRHQIRGEHVLIHHTPAKSTVVYRADVSTIDDCTFWKISVVYSAVMALLSIFGVGAALNNKAATFIQTKIINNPALQSILRITEGGLTAVTFFQALRELYSKGVLWPLIKIILENMGWWALGKLLVKLIVRIFGAAVSIAETIAELVIAVAQLIITINDRPDRCSF